MKNKLKFSIFIIFYFYFSLNNVIANEPFTFDVSEIEILENGNQINGYNNGTVTSEDGSTIYAQNFFYNKLTNILEASGNVKYIDKIKNTYVTADKAIYIKNEEKIFTVGNSKAINNNITIKASNLEYDKFKNIFEAKKNAVVNDFEKDTTIYADEISYFKNNEKIFTKGKTKALIESKYKFNSENVTYYRNLGDLTSKKRTTL